MDHVVNNGHVVDMQDVFQRLSFDTTCIFVTGYDPMCHGLYPRTLKSGRTGTEVVVAGKRRRKNLNRKGGGRSCSAARITAVVEEKRRWHNCVFARGEGIHRGENCVHLLLMKNR
ncbi:hypothetical protein POM88_050048 [Heracleum sosnowskyi]|uniref:Uncharacterized protein n=1 Tax=Heracleum sosnowskyi TaxID=360622 RepID=A0AAD8M263_9APIA|nr:hypothetical protein POM88_050048 [Heracleum sosnowskyi]